MKFKRLVCIIAALFAIQIAGIALFLTTNNVENQDIVEINDIVQDCTTNFESLSEVATTYKYDFSVINNEGELLFSTKSGLSNSVEAAVKNRDSILDITVDGVIRGKLIINSNYAQAMNSKNAQFMVFMLIVSSCMAVLLVVYIIYINKQIIKPFDSLRSFATDISKGNLETQLDMDKQNIFGAFTESFDIMRTELKNAKDAEHRAKESKKLLIANLSHDIKTPVASIKAIAEVGEIKAATKDKQAFDMINKKADQVNELISNLFFATLEEMNQLSINMSDYSSKTLLELINSSNYLGLATVSDIPEMLLTFDKQRLQQVIDNIISNSYKYANTKIDISCKSDDNFMQVHIKDYGGCNENPENLLTKFYRGSNADGKEGTGLGLYISKYLMTAMGGDLTLDIQSNYFCVILSIRIS